jgi:hypothetical protein
MPYNASDTAKKLIALLNNAKELSVAHSNRTLAIDTINSSLILCKSRSFGLEEGLPDILESLIYAIRSYKPEVLLEEFHKAEEFVIITDIGETKTQKPKIPELPYANMNVPLD